MTDWSGDRDLALATATELHRDRFTLVAAVTGVAAATRELLDTAGMVFRWLVGPVSITLAFGPIQDQDTLEPTGETGSAVTQLRDNEQFTLTLTAQDAKGAAVLDDTTTTTDDPAWTSSDEQVFTIVVDPANSRSATVKAALPGSATGTVAIGDISATFAVDVVPGAVALVNLAEGPVTEQA